MAGETTVPLLPCESIDVIAEFYGVLGFQQTYVQKRPNPYVALKRDDIELHFFGMPGFRPEDSYGTCLVAVPDTGELFRAFAEGMRGAYGKILVSGIPRMTRPRVRKNSGNTSGFTVIDPGGNWIRIMAKTAGPADEAPVVGRLSASLRSAVVMGDSHGKADQAARILDAALERNRDTAGPLELLEALAYRAELAVRCENQDAAREYLARAFDIELTDAQRRAGADALAGLEDVEAAL
ncbi:hypothetical protein LZ318_27805 [Saccharopolyspora indica]